MLTPSLTLAGNISGLRDEWDVPAKSIFTDPITHLLSIWYVLVKILSYVSAKKIIKKTFLMAVFK